MEAKNAASGPHVTSQTPFENIQQQRTAENGLLYSGQVKLGDRTINVSVMVPKQKLEQLQAQGKLNEVVQQTALKTAQTFILAEAKEGPLQKMTVKGENVKLEKGADHTIKVIQLSDLRHITQLERDASRNALLTDKCWKDIFVPIATNINPVVPKEVPSEPVFDDTDYDEIQAMVDQASSKETEKPEPKEAKKIIEQAKQFVKELEEKFSKRPLDQFTEDDVKQFIQRENEFLPEGKFINLPEDDKKFLRKDPEWGELRDKLAAMGDKIINAAQRNKGASPQKPPRADVTREGS